MSTPATITTPRGASGYLRWVAWREVGKSICHTSMHLWWKSKCTRYTLFFYDACYMPSVEYPVGEDLVNQIWARTYKLRVLIQLFDAYSEAYHTLRCLITVQAIRYFNRSTSVCITSSFTSSRSHMTHFTFIIENFQSSSKLPISSE